MTDSQTLPTLDDVLMNGEIQVTGRFVYGSNYTFLVEVEWQGHSTPAVYKPSRGERPLWDFPDGTLAAREVAAYLVSQALGWELVPLTVLRSDGPAEGGSLQQFIHADPEINYFTLTESQKARLKPMAAFDALVNNADRKGGHILLGEDGHFWSIDHGVCFHVEPKLRSVIWDFAGDPLPPELVGDLEQFVEDLERDPLQLELSTLLSAAELRALRERAERLARGASFPVPGPGRPYPWPPV